MRTTPSLLTRKEAHITVINPQEFGDVLGPAGVTPDEINAIAEKHHIQSSKFKVLCLGRSHVTIKDGPDTVYFLVASSPDLVKIRQAIQRVYLRKGGEPSLFEAEAFWPHITVGFTIRDVFLLPDDHVFKGTNTCVRPVHVVSPPRKHRKYKGNRGRKGHRKYKGHKGRKGHGKH